MVRNGHPGRNTSLQVPMRGVKRGTFKCRTCEGEKIRVSRRKPQKKKTNRAEDGTEKPFRIYQVQKKKADRLLMTKSQRRGTNSLNRHLENKQSRGKESDGAKQAERAELGKNCARGERNFHKEQEDVFRREREKGYASIESRGERVSRE